MSFENDIEKFAKKSLHKAEKIRRGAALKLFTAVIKDTPVDKGILIGNWQTSIGSPKTNMLDIEDPNGDMSVGGAVYQLGSEVGLDRPIYMSNNMPYAMVAEYGLWSGAPSEKLTSKGYSRKAPVGMVRVNVTRFKKLLAIEVTKLPD